MRVARPSPLAPARLRPLRAPPARTAATPWCADRKTGFCLGDRYPSATRAAGRRAARSRATASRCGLDQPGPARHPRGHLGRLRRRLRGEPRGPVPAAQRAARRAATCSCTAPTPTGACVESSYDNNASSVLLRLRRHRGAAADADPRRLPRHRALHRRALTLAAVGARSRAAPPRRAAMRVETVATGLEIPWEIAFLPDGRALVTERPGACGCSAAHGRLRRAPVAHVRGERARRGRAARPRASTRLRAQPPRLPLLHDRRPACGSSAGAGRRRGSCAGRRSSTGIAAGQVHDSGRIAFGPDRRLYVSTGDAGQARAGAGPGVAQRQAARARRRRSTAAAGRCAPAVVALGLRNSQGFDWQPGTGRLIATDHGPSGLRRPRGLRRGQRARRRRQLRLAARRSATRPAAAASTRRCASTPRRSRRPARRSSPAAARAGPATTCFAALRGRSCGGSALRDGRVVARPAAADRGPLRPPADRRRGPARRPLRAHEQPRRPRLPADGRRPHPAGCGRRT